MSTLRPVAASNRTIPMPKGFRFLRAAACAAVLAGPAVAEGPSPDTVLATVNGEAITLGHVMVL